MVFVAGPRQVGKTTLARMLPGARRGYLNWDVAEDRERILRRELPASGLWVFDEIHKYTDGREVDFVVVDRRQPVRCVACTWADSPVAKSLRYFKVRFPTATRGKSRRPGRRTT